MMRRPPAHRPGARSLSDMTRAAFAVGLLLACAVSAQAIQQVCNAYNRSAISYVGAESGLWYDSNNWYCSLLPCPGDNVSLAQVCVAAPRRCPRAPLTASVQAYNYTVDVTINVTVTVASLAFGASEDIVLTSRGQLAISDSVDGSTCVYKEEQAELPATIGSSSGLSPAVYVPIIVILAVLVIVGSILAVA